MTESNKTLVILTPGFPKNEEDSNCLPMQQSFIRNIKKNYPRLHIIILSFQYPYHTHNYTWFGIPVIPFGGRNKGWLKKLLVRKKIRSALHSIHKKHRIDGLLSFWYNECGYIGKKFGEQHSIKHFCWIWGQDARKINNYPRKLSPSPTELVVLSDFLREEFERNHHTRPGFVVPLGIDNDDFSALPVKKEIDILATGSLIPLKQYDIFIRVVAQIAKQLPGVNAVLIGSGPEEGRLKKQIREAGLESTIELKTGLSHAGILNHMRSAKVFLHTSSYEGFGQVCLEALHAGAHVISFTKPMNTEIKHWQIAASQEEMVNKTLDILTSPVIDHTPVTPYKIGDTVKRMMDLFGI